MSEHNKRFLLLLLLLVALCAVGQMTNTIYVPAMGRMAARFVVLPTHIQTVMAVYLLTYGASQFFYGPLSDMIGRRPAILLGLVVFIMGSAMAAIAQTFTLLLIGSLVQGMGTGVGGVMARTVMRDVYSGRQLHQASSYVSMALIVSPLVAPLIGGFLTVNFTWRANFIFLLGLGLAVFIFQFLCFRETNPHIGSLENNVKTLLKDHGCILKNTMFLGNMICLLVTFAGVSVFEASAGVIFSDLMHYRPETISWLFVLPVPAYIVGAYLSGRLSYRFETNSVIRFGAFVLLLSSGIMLALACLGVISVYLVLIPVAFYLFGGGILFPAATSGALDPFPKRAGTAGAILGGVQNLGAGGFTAISASLPQTSLIPLSGILFSLSLLVLIAYWFLLRPAAP